MFWLFKKNAYLCDVERDKQRRSSEGRSRKDIIRYSHPRDARSTFAIDRLPRVAFFLIKKAKVMKNKKTTTPIKRVVRELNAECFNEVKKNNKGGEAYVFIDALTSLFTISSTKLRESKTFKFVGKYDSVSWVRSNVGYHGITFYRATYGKKVADKVFADCSSMIVEAKNPHYSCASPMRMLPEFVFKHYAAMYNDK